MWSSKTSDMKIVPFTNLTDETSHSITVIITLLLEDVSVPSWTAGRPLLKSDCRAALAPV